MSNTESRKEFEEWIKSEFIVSHEELLQKVGSGAYVDTMTHWYWKTWQASRAKPIVLPAELVFQRHSHSDCNADSVESMVNGANWMRTLAKEAIEAAGYGCE